MRVKVSIRCKSCGERFILRARKDRGKLETGFKQCICDNTEAFEIEEIAL
jgi:DNA-directed RNA polymerase subunit RPC12/RpoP